MSTLTRGVTALRPEPTEVALAHLAPGSAVRVETGQDVRDHGPLLKGGPLVVTFAGEALGWGFRVCLYGDLRRAGLGRHPLDRTFWQEAVKGVTGFGVAYLNFRLVEHFDKSRWTAVGLRFEEPQAAREPGDLISDICDAFAFTNTSTKDDEKRDQ